MKKFVFGVFALVFAFAVANTSVSAQMYRQSRMKRTSSTRQLPLSLFQRLLRQLRQQDWLRRSRAKAVHGFRTG